MKKFGFVVAMILGGACSGDKIDGFIGDVEGFKSKMCACTDKACTDKVHADYKKWENDTLEPAMKGMDEKSIAKDKTEKFMAARRGMRECRRKFDDGALPSTTTPGSAATP